MPAGSRSPEATTSPLRFVALEVRGLRTLAEVRLPLDGLSVLIGANGSGKSSFVEAFELLRLAGTAESFLPELRTVHGLLSLLRRGETALRLRVEAAGADGDYVYQIDLDGSGGGAAIQAELLVVSQGGRAISYIERTGQGAQVADDSLVLRPAGSFSADRLTLRAWGDRPPHAAIARMASLLAGIDVQVPFDTLPGWLARRKKYEQPLRTPAVLGPARRLEVQGDNLANAWHAINADPKLRDAGLRQVRLGLGPDVEAVLTPADLDFGRVALRLRVSGEDLPASVLSEGQLAYLGFVALALLADGTTLLAFDEPECHLHPELLMRVLDLFQELARDRPIVLCTHSDRLLDGLGDAAADAAVLLSLDEQRRTTLRFPDAAQLGIFLDEFSGLGEVRARGYERTVLTSPPWVAGACGRQ